MSTKTLTYGDTWYDAPKRDDITRGKTVREGATVEADYTRIIDNTHVPCTYVDSEGKTWYKNVLLAGLK